MFTPTPCISAAKVAAARPTLISSSITSPATSASPCNAKGDILRKSFKTCGSVKSIFPPYLISSLKIASYAIASCGDDLEVTNFHVSLITQISSSQYFFSPSNPVLIDSAKSRAKKRKGCI